MEDKDLSLYYEEKLAEMPKDVLEKAVNVIQELYKDDKHSVELMKKEYEKNPTEWAIPYHHYWGRGIRNHLRENGLKDDLLPDGNWDDYYIQVVEIVLGLREMPT